MYYPRLRDLREDGDYVQKEIAAYPGIDQRVYRTYETGKREIPTRHVIKLAYFYKASTNYILGQSDIRAPYGKSTAFDRFLLRKSVRSESVTVRKQHRKAAVSPSWESR